MNPITRLWSAIKSVAEMLERLSKLGNRMCDVAEANVMTIEDREPILIESNGRRTERAKR